MQCPIHRICWARSTMSPVDRSISQTIQLAICRYTWDWISSCWDWKTWIKQSIQSSRLETARVLSPHASKSPQHNIGSKKSPVHPVQPGSHWHVKTQQGLRAGAWRHDQTGDTTKSRTDDLRLYKYDDAESSNDDKPRTLRLHIFSNSFVYKPTYTLRHQNQLRLQLFTQSNELRLQRMVQNAFFFLPCLRRPHEANSSNWFAKDGPTYFHGV